MDNLNFLYKYNLDEKVRKKHEWKNGIESTCELSIFGLSYNGQNIPKKS